MNNSQAFHAERSSRWLANTLVLGALVISAACGSSKDAKVSDPNITGNTNTTTPTTDANGNTTGTAANCNSSGTNSFTGSDSPVTFAATSGGNSVPVGKVLYITNQNVTPALADLNRTFKVTAYDYDYCDFTYEYGYGSGPLAPSHSATFYLVNGTPGASLAPGDYTIGATSGMYVVTAGSTVAATTSPKAGAKCGGNYYNPVSGKITLTTVPSASDGTRFTAGLVGSFSVTLSSGANLGGSFTSGGCAVSNPTSWDATRVNACTCSL